MPTHQLLFGFPLRELRGIGSSLDEGLARMARAGYQVIVAGEASLAEDGVLEAIRRHRLRLVFQCAPASVADLQTSLRRARELVAVSVNARVQTADPGEEEDVVELLNGMYGAARNAGVNLLLENDHGLLARNLSRTARLCERVQNVRLALDVGHFLLSERHMAPTADLAPLLDGLLSRAEMISGRLPGNQNEGDGSAELPQLYTRLWAEAMRRWKIRSRAGSALVYTPVLSRSDTFERTLESGAEQPDVWARSQEIRSLGEQAWAEAKRATGPLWP